MLDINAYSFVDRDMFMRYRGGGIGHKYIREWSSRLAMDGNIAIADELTEDTQDIELPMSQDISDDEIDGESNDEGFREEESDADSDEHSDDGGDANSLDGNDLEMYN